MLVSGRNAGFPEKLPMGMVRQPELWGSWRGVVVRSHQHPSSGTPPGPTHIYECVCGTSLHSTKAKFRITSAGRPCDTVGPWQVSAL